MFHYHTFGDKVLQYSHILRVNYNYHTNCSNHWYTTIHPVGLYLPHKCISFFSEYSNVCYLSKWLEVRHQLWIWIENNTHLLLYCIEKNRIFFFAILNFATRGHDQWPHRVYILPRSAVPVVQGKSEISHNSGTTSPPQFLLLCSLWHKSQLL